MFTKDQWRIDGMVLFRHQQSIAWLISSCYSTCQSRRLMLLKAALGHLN